MIISEQINKLKLNKKKNMHQALIMKPFPIHSNDWNKTSKYNNVKDDV